MEVSFDAVSRLCYYADRGGDQREGSVKRPEWPLFRTPTPELIHMRTSRE